MVRLLWSFETMVRLLWFVCFGSFALELWSFGSFAPK